MPSALVTGASSGIGRAYALRLAELGYDLVLVARREDRLREVADQIGTAEILVADLERPEGISAVECRIREGPALDLLVNNAGFAARAAVKDLDVPAFERLMRVNVLAVAQLSSAAMHRMMAEGSGSIVNVASGSVFAQLPGNAGYGSSKAFVIAFTRHMQAEAQNSGVFVQLLIPGVIATNFHEVAGADLGRFPPHMVMDVEQFVAGAVAGLERREPVCIPAMPDLATWEAYLENERALLPQVSRDRLADRYG